MGSVDIDSELPILGGALLLRAERDEQVNFCRWNSSSVWDAGDSRLDLARNLQRSGLSRAAAPEGDAERQHRIRYGSSGEFRELQTANFWRGNRGARNLCLPVHHGGDV